MSLPVSQYEALLAEVRGLRKKAQRVQQLARPLLRGEIENVGKLDFCSMESLHTQHHSDFGHQSSSDDEFHTDRNFLQIQNGAGISTTQMSVSSEPARSSCNRLYHGTWPVEGASLWNSEPTNVAQPTIQNDVGSMMSFASSSGAPNLELPPPGGSSSTTHQLEAKVDMVYSLLSILGGQEHADMGETLLALSTSPESCQAMRASGCIPLLVQLVQSDRDVDGRAKAFEALQNLVAHQSDEKVRKREMRVLKLVAVCRSYMERVRAGAENDDLEDTHPVQTVAHVMKLSFDEGHRQAICQLGGIHAIASLVETEHSIHGSTASTLTENCILMRRYACMALTNITFGDSGNKSLLCSYRDFMRALVVQLQSSSDELRQVTASLLRNLSWRADATSKLILREVGSVSGLMKSAMMPHNKEATLKSILSALWNLSAHCVQNKSEICAIENAIAYICTLLSSKTPAIVENGGGILRNISSQIAVREDYREILRKQNCLNVLLDHLKSASLTIVSNACGTLWNLSAKCAVDQEHLWAIGAPSMLRSLNHSKHKMIAMGSSAALKNLLAASGVRRSGVGVELAVDVTALQMDLPVLPTLGARKQKNLRRELDELELGPEWGGSAGGGESEKAFLGVGVYAETDLDQPTDYSKRYKDDDTDDEVDEVDDTLKTYCTEGTPLNFSTATSMSDLRCASETKSKKSIEKSLDEKDEVDLGEEEDLLVVAASEDKPVNYCEEGTPGGCLSRVSSCASLAVKKNVLEEDEEGGKIKEVKNDEGRGKVGEEEKIVVVKQQVNYAEETPLMFSRSSSLASLDSVEQHSIHDDRSSVVSDFSRLTSGIVSPSELPDSPSQTVPPSPKPRTKPLEFAPPTAPSTAPLPLTSQLSQLTLKDSPDNKLATSQPTDHQNDVIVPKPPQFFDDSVSKFKEESTPIQFSTATSLSSLLTIDAENEDEQQKKSAKVSPSSGESEEDEDHILAACITAGMQTTTTAAPSTLLSDDEDDDANNILAECIQSGMPVARPLGGANIALAPTNTNKTTAAPFPADEVREWILENSPCQFSLRSSLSDLTSVVDGASSASALLKERVLTEKACDLLKKSDSLSSLSVESLEAEQALLEQCISSGKPVGIATKTFHESKNAMRASVVGAMATGVQEDVAVDVKSSPSGFSERMLDPDAMIESLDRFTAELVSQASRGTGGTTWSSEDVETDVTESGAPDVITFDEDSRKLPQVFALLSNCSSLESGLDATNPPSALFDSLIVESVFEDCVSSVAKEHLKGIAATMICSGIENVNPPSLFNDITDMCNSLADVPTATYDEDDDETTIFEDCVTLSDDIPQSATSNTPPPPLTPSTTTNNATSNTPPIPKIASTAQPIRKSSLSLIAKKKRRNLERDRYKTYTIAAVETIFQENAEVVAPSIPPRTKEAIRKSFLQKRHENRDDRFKTQTIIEGAVNLALEQPPQELIDSIEDEFVNYRTYRRGKSANSAYCPSDNTATSLQVAPPRVVKPKVDEVVKAVRGRRRPLYTKPKLAPPIVNKSEVKKVVPAAPSTRKIERQSTFTKDEEISTPKSKIPSRIARAVKSAPATTSSARFGYNRSMSVEAPSSSTRIHSSTSSHSLKSVATSSKDGATKSSPNVAAKKQVTSKIASLWKKIEDSKNAGPPKKKDSRVWIRSGEVEVAPSTRGGVQLRNAKPDGVGVKRMSRLGSFVVVDEPNGGAVQV